MPFPRHSCRLDNKIELQKLMTPMYTVEEASGFDVEGEALLPPLPSMALMCVCAVADPDVVTTSEARDVTFFPTLESKVEEAKA